MSDSKGAAIDEILAGLANYIVESIHLEPTSVMYRKLNQKQAKQAILAILAQEVKRASSDGVKLARLTIEELASKEFRDGRYRYSDEISTILDRLERLG